jgi:hypothetical protein
MTEIHDVLRGQVGLLNALKETQREQGETLAEHGKRLDRLERKVDTGFAQTDKNFAKVEGQLKEVRTGIAKITGLLTDESDKREEP